MQCSFLRPYQAALMACVRTQHPHSAAAALVQIHLVCDEKVLYIYAMTEINVQIDGEASFLKIALDIKTLPLTSAYCHESSHIVAS